MKMILCHRNGGWCMHDEATTHYVDMIDQTTLGHRAIKKQFNITPRAGWQIDPFGHSAVQAYLLGAEVCIYYDVENVSNMDIMISHHEHVFACKFLWLIQLVELI